MVCILSPSKTVDDSTVHLHRHTRYIFQEEVQSLITILKKIDTDGLMKLMKISRNLAEQNYHRYQEFTFEFNTENSKAALLTFKGEAYAGLNAKSFSISDLEYAQDHLRILSGLYGCLKPLDLIKAYRLEMGTTLKTSSGHNLYQFWGKKIADSIHDAVRQSESNFLVNLASEEYFKSINKAALNTNVIHIQFYEMKGNIKSFVSFNAKKARGLMANFVIRNQIQLPEQLREFNSEGYTFEKSMSENNVYTFVRSAGASL